MVKSVAWKAILLFLYICVLEPMWTHFTTLTIGSLQNIGFSSSGNIIILSAFGRSIYDMANGQLSFRDEADWWDDFKDRDGAIPGFGGEKDAHILLSGLHTKNELEKTTADGWELYFEDGLNGNTPVKQFFIKNETEQVFITDNGPGEVRTYGFCQDERLLVVATSCELVVWKRN